MAIKHSISILLSKFEVVYKMIFFYAFVFLFFAAIGIGAISSKINPIISQLTNGNLLSEFRLGIVELFSGKPRFMEHFANAANMVDVVKEGIVDYSHAFTSSFVIAVVIIFFFNFFIVLSQLPFSDVVNNFMNSNSKFGFMSNFVANIKTSLKYSLVFIFTAFPIDIVLSVAVFYIAKGLFRAIPLMALPITFVIAVIFIAARLAITTGWIPSIVCENKGVFRAFIDGFKAIKKKFFNAFWSYVSAITLCFAFVVLFSFATFGVGLIIGVPTVITLMKILELVIYYNCQGYYYYIDKATIIKTSFYD